MNVTDVMQEIATRLQTIATFQQVNDRPVDSIVTPAAMVALPEEIAFDATYGRGVDTMTLPVLVLVAKVSDAGSRDQLLAYAAATGTQSVKAVIESGVYTKFDVVRVASCRFEVEQVQAVDYIGAVFTLEIAGRGAA